MAGVAQIRKTPLYGQHVNAGGRIVEFAGYLMPIEYKGIMAEHEQVRMRSGLFDLTHMGEIEVRGERAGEFVNYIITNDAVNIPDFAIVYTAVCREDGGILDDALAYKYPDHYMMVVNAVNKDKILKWMLKWAPRFNCTVTDLSDETALIAIQGPDSEDVLQKLTETRLDQMKYYNFAEGKVSDIPCVISRTGYTGEDGFEIYLKNESAPAIWADLMTAGREYGIEPIGLGARDTLRLEAKLALYGNELNEERNPIEVGLKWVVKLDKPDFIGKSALQKVDAEKPARKLIGFELKKNGVPRTGYPVLNADGEEIGVVTSGTFSPTLKKAIGLALVKKEGIKIGTPIKIRIRKNEIPAEVIKTPFHRGSVKAGN